MDLANNDFFDDFLSDFLPQLNITDTITTQYESVRIKFNEGVKYAKDKLYDKAVKSFQDALLERKTEIAIKIIIYDNMVKSLLSNEMFDEAKAILDDGEFKKLSQKTNNLNAYYSLYVKYFFKTYQPIEGLKYQNEAWKLAQKEYKKRNKQMPNIIYFGRYHNITLFNLQLKFLNQISDEDYEEVLPLFDKMLKYASDKKEKSQVYHLKSIYFKLLNDSENEYKNAKISYIYFKNPKVKEILNRLNPEKEAIVDRYSQGILTEQEIAQKQEIANKHGQDNVIYQYFNQIAMFDELGKVEKR